MSLERFLEKAEHSSDELLDLSKQLTRNVKWLRKSALLGVLNDIPRALDELRSTADRLHAEVARAKEAYTGEHSYQWDGNRFIEELLRTARDKGIRLHKQDDYLYCQPVLIRVLSEQAAVLIDKTRESRVRPSVLVDRLRKLQNAPARFNSRAFLKSLYNAYTRTKGAGKGGVSPLADIYEVLTLLPGQKKEYTRHEFARDLYLLDCDRLAASDHGRLMLHRARGNESARHIFTTVSKDGELVRYYGVSFIERARR
jgi:hypothetical protein